MTGQNNNHNLVFIFNSSSGHHQRMGLIAFVTDVFSCFCVCGSPYLTLILSSAGEMKLSQTDDD